MNTSPYQPATYPPQQYQTGQPYTGQPYQQQYQTAQPYTGQPYQPQYQPYQTGQPYQQSPYQTGQPYQTGHPYHQQINQPYTEQTYSQPIHAGEHHVPLDTHPIHDNTEKFKKESGYRDIIFLILFVVHFAALGAIIGYGFTHQAPQEDDYHGLLPYNMTNGGDLHTLATNLEMVAILVGVSLLVSVGYLQLMKAFTAQLIYIGIGFSILSSVGMALYAGLTGQIVVAVILGIFAIFSIVYFFLIRSRIPFAVEMIKSVVTVIQNYPATQVTAYLSIIIQIAWICLWFFAVILAQRFSGGLSSAASIFLIFSLYWVTEVIKNVVHVTVSGVVATVYFMGDAMPANPTLGALKRSLTTSFGSICLGSLIVSIIKTIRTLVRMLRSEENSFLLCLVDAILGCIDSLVQYFNHYAYCQVAIYGKTFVSAAKATWNLFQHAGLEAIANDNLIDGVLWMGVLFNALVTGAVAVGLTYILHETHSTLVMFILGFVIGFVMMILGMQTVDSAVACTFVCFAEDRGVLQRTNPHLYQKLVSTYNL